LGRGGDDVGVSTERSVREHCGHTRKTRTTEVDAKERLVAGKTNEWTLTERQSERTGCRKSIESEVKKKKKKKREIYYKFVSMASDTGISSVVY
jgi:hypothetical protein